MMARWELHSFARQLGQLKPQLVLIAGGNDTAIPPDDAVRVQALVPVAKVVPLPGLGHLAHEEAPAKIAELIEDIALASRKRSQS